MGIKERREREKDARREEIIKAAEKVFFTRGLAEATMDDVAQASELSKGTLYLYYKSKEELYLAVAMNGMEIMHNMFKDAISTDEPSIKHISNIGRAYFRFFDEHREHFRTFYFFESPQFLTQVSGEMLQVCAEQDKRVWDTVVTPIRRAIDEGMLHKELDPLEVGVMLWSNMNGLMRLIDRHEDHWKNLYGIDLAGLVQKSGAFLMEAMMTDEAKKKFSSVLLYHDPGNEKSDAEPHTTK